MERRRWLRIVTTDGDDVGGTTSVAVFVALSRVHRADAASTFPPRAWSLSRASESCSSQRLASSTRAGITRPLARAVNGVVGKLPRVLRKRATLLQVARDEENAAWKMPSARLRSEERRVGKECRSRWTVAAEEG